MYYKVVRVRENKFYSSMVRNAYCLEYAIGRETIPANNSLGIFVFKELEYARDFASCNEVILKCKVTQPRKMRFRSTINVTLFQNFWNTYAINKQKHKDRMSNISEISRTPKGTYIVSSVFPIEVVE